jgi:DNA-directed RNA polymerase specialized sigma24 family protein
MTPPTPAEDSVPPDWQPILHEEVDRLPQKYRLVVVLCYLQGKTHEEAARQLGWPLGVRLSNGGKSDSDIVLRLW